MRGDHPASSAATATDDGARSVRSLLRPPSWGRRRERLTVVAALAATIPLVAARVALNLPTTVPGQGLAGSVDALTALATAGPAAAAIAVGLARRDLLDRVGLVAAGVFALLALVDDAAVLPAAGALAVAGALVLRPRSPIAPQVDPSRLRAAAVAAVAAALALGFAGSLLAAAGVAPADFRQIGGVAVAAGLAGLPLADRPADRRAWFVGGAVAAAAFAVGVAMPFVTGAAVLVVAGAVGVPLVLLALGAGGAATVVTDAALGGRPLPAVGGLLLLGAGVPGSIQRAVAFVLGAALVATSLARDAGGPDGAEVGERG